MTTGPQRYVESDTDSPVPTKGAVEEQLRLVASVEPGVVFTSLASQSVIDLCDHCAIDIVDGGQARYRIVHPPTAADTGGLLRLADRAGMQPDRRVEVLFAHSPQDERYGDDDERQMFPGFRGSATFIWDRRAPSTSDRTMASLLVEHAVTVVSRQRSEHLAATANTRAGNLEIALANSRSVGTAVGILMSLHKITDTEAFELLRAASQRINRKVRDLAMDVIATGWLDPNLLPGPRTRNEPPARVRPQP